MFSRMKNWSIRKKLTLIVMQVTTAALILTGMAIGVYEYLDARTRLEERLETLAQVIGGNSTAAIQFGNREDAAATLKTLSVQKNIQAACIYMPSGDILATYTSADAIGFKFPQRELNNGQVFRGGFVDVYEPAMLDGKPVGTVYLHSDLNDIYRRTY